MAERTDRTITVAILALPDSAPLGIHGLFEVLSAVGRLWPRLTGTAGCDTRFRPLILARTAAPFRSVVGIPIFPDHGLDEAPPADVVVVADVELPLAGDPAHGWAVEIAWLRRQAEATRLICSTCTGSLVLAEAGLLDGRDAASHWSAADLFRDRYPKVRYRADRILCDSGQDGRLITTGGASSWQDLALYLIGRFCGAEEAARIARIFLIGDRKEGQLPYAAMARPRVHDDALIQRCQEWIGDHYQVANPVAAMSERSGLPDRTFKRRFLKATGYTPLDYVQALRIEEAKQLLETESGPVEALAEQVGYDDPAFFRKLFRRRVGITPARYRQKMRSMLPRLS
ncbi:GlxA family transcriptional regulator [Sphingosinicella terrae]|uniref:GlxA family transcriptional regulator n=1 Tax=Sphingosinicella terrae TaxID=2172047 RepID=UPI0025489D3B|nr:helix-turn-helix domain-containing protein [Sphingosinicella terrae]